MIFAARNCLLGLESSLRRLCSGTVTPTQTLPHRGGGLLRARYVTVIERHTTARPATFLDNGCGYGRNLSTPRGPRSRSVPARIPYTGLDGHRGGRGHRRRRRGALGH